MLKTGLIFIVLTLLINSLFFNGPVAMSLETTKQLKIHNKTATSLRFIICQNQFRVGDRMLLSSIDPQQITQIQTNYLNSSIEEKNITIYIIPSNESANSILLEKKFDNSCDFDSSVVTYTNLAISKNSNISLLIEGSTVSNGLEKTTPSLTIDNTAHLIGMDLSNFHPYEGSQTLSKSKIFTPDTTGLVYKTMSSKQNEVCLDKKSIKLQLIPHQSNNKTIYLGFIPLDEGIYTISPKPESGCDFANPDLIETIAVYQNQYVIATGSSTINPLYKESGIVIINDVDKKVK